MQNIYPVKVLDIVENTEEAVNVYLDVPFEFHDTFNYKPGQYITLEFNINNQIVRRSYSLCSSPVLNESLKICVKRVEKGLVSNYINDSLKVGGTVNVLPPDGRFFADIKNENYKTYYLFAAGSGITPILSILRTVLLIEEQSYVYMIYGNRTENLILFKKELDELQEEYGDRFILEYTLSRPKSTWSEIWKGNNGCFFRKGRVDTQAVKWLIDEYPLYAQNAEYYICGPGTMSENTKKTLNNIDVPDERIFIEKFGGNESKDTTEAFENAKLAAQLNGETIQVTIPKGKTILRTLIDAGKEPPYSCEGGVCSTCMCKLINGEVLMKNNLALTDKAIKQGYILSCQSVPLTEEVEVEFE